jgi:hypothetical protein
LALLLDHETSARAGVADKISIGTQIELEGYLLANEAGAQVQAELEAGFPWQLSIRVEPDHVEEVPLGGTAIVNGRHVDGPVRIFRHNRVHEVSFTALGVDSSTYAIAASDFNPLIADALRRAGKSATLSALLDSNPLIADAKRRMQDHQNRSTK